jgi:predicted  nucleic acid-binding Zn-ribbon protein
LQRYEALRRTKGGLAVAKVVRGLCQACRMSLPTQLQQRVRNGRQTVLCSSCGRMLLLS